MLEEIATINEMLSETLAYMREVGQAESAAPTDLPSLLQTISAQFADTGHDVVYRGPDRLVLSCRPHALTRAVTNLVDNATKFGSAVEVVMTSPVIVGTPATPLEECAAVMTSRRLRHLPIVDEERLVGMVTIGDVLAQRLVEQEVAIAELNRYVFDLR